MSRRITVGLIEVPNIALYDSQGANRAPRPNRNVLISKQVLMSNLEAGGFEVRLYNLKAGDWEHAYGEVPWKDGKLIKAMVGTDYRTISPDECDVWGVTCNFQQHRNSARLIMQHLGGTGHPVIAGGSDVIAEPQLYLEAGADAVVLDKSGAANWAVIDCLTGRSPRGELSGVLFRDGRRVPLRIRPTTPEQWALPSSEIAQQCMGMDYWANSTPAELTPIGSVVTDIGCDRKCDFCQTPGYRLGYKAMSPQVIVDWFRSQKDAGARSVVFSPDQFLARLLWDNGRDDILEAMAGIRGLDLSWMWPNGLELRKMTWGRGYADADLTPDEELLNALIGWQGGKGCFHLYVPAERPLNGRENYSKLLPWREHCDMMKAVVRTGVPALTYGCIIGFEDDSDESLSQLEEGVGTLFEELRTINPALDVQVAAYALSPIPGTPQAAKVHSSGLVRFFDPEMLGGLWAPCMDTRYLSYEQVSEWQRRLLRIGIGDHKSQFMNDVFQ